MLRQANTNKTMINNHKLLKNTLIISLLLLSLVLIFSFTAGTVSAVVISPSPSSNVIYVNDSGNDDNDGSSWFLAKKSIKNATGNVAEGGTVNIANGLYTGENNTGITINKSMTITGQSKSGTIIDAQGKDIFHISSGINVTILNLTLKNGTSSLGGAISNKGNLTVNNCDFTGNRAGVVGGAIINYGTLNVTGCTFTDNIAIGDGGAIASSGTCTVTGSTFTNNTAVSGGAIFNYGSTLTVTGCTFSGNIVTGDFETGGGAAIYSTGTLNIKDSTFTDNDAAVSDSAAIYNNGGTLDVRNSIFTNNKGGAIVNEMVGTLTVTNSKFTGNTVIYHGGAIWNYGTLTVTGSTFTGNRADGDGGAIWNDGEGDLTVNFCRIVGNTANGYGDAIYNYGESEQSANAQNNWWGSNNPDFDSLVSGNVDYTPWLYMTIAANPTTINNGETSLITVSFNNLFDGTTITPLNLADGHIPDGSPVNFQTDLGTIGCKSIDKTTTGGIATAILTATELAGIAHINATTDNQTLFVNVTITPTSSLYLKVTSNKTNPVVGDTVLYTLKVGNKGPDTAKDVVMTYVVPEGLEFLGAEVDVGEWEYDDSTRTITWIIGDVPVGDPYMWLSLRIAHAGQYLINPALITITYDPTLNSDTQSLTVNAAAQSNNNNSNGSSGNTVKAASKTVSMQETGLPITGLIIAVLMVISGLVPKRK